MSQTVAASKVRTLTLIERPCAACGSHNHELLWLNHFTVKTRHEAWQFEMQNVICQDCGFAFVSPTPLPEDLQAYYQDSFPYLTDQAIDYDINKRLHFIQKHLQPGFTNYLEIGANAETAFHQQLRHIFASVSTVEPNQNVASNHRSLQSIPDASADIVTSYFVLEHIPQVQDFFENCRRVLKPGGILMIEVPDLNYYPTDMSAMRFHEHVNHFSLISLQRTAALHGFELLEGDSAFCSRYFGFAAAFALKTDDSLPTDLPNEYAQNRQTFRQGLDRVRAFQEKLSHLQNQVTTMARQGKKVVLWAANTNLVHFMNGYELPEGVKVVDSNPDKRHFLTATLVYQPSEMASHIQESELLVIFCGAVHKQSILDSLKVNYNKSFPDDGVILVDFW